MKLSRKILGVAAGIGVLGASSIAMAAPATTAMEQLLPENIDAVYTLDTTVKNPFEDHLKDWIKESMITEDSASDTALVDLILDNNHLVYAMDMPENIESEPGILKDPEMYMAVRVDEAGFKALYEKAKAEMTITEETYNGETLYVGDDNNVVVHVGGLFIMTSSKEDAMAVVDRYKGTKNDALANFNNYQEVMSHGNDKAFFSMYINPAEMGDQITEALNEVADVFPQFTQFNEKMVNSLKGEGIWVSQSSTGFVMNVAVEGDNAELKELNMNFDKNNFVPKLWQKLSGKGLIMYSEANLADSWMEDATMLYGDLFSNEEFVAWKKEFKTDSGIDFDKEIMSLMKNQQMITMHKTDQLFPGFTWMVDVSNNRDANHSTVEKLNEYIKTQMVPVEKEVGVDFFKSEVAEVSGMKFYKNTFNFGAILRAEGDLVMDLVSDDQVTLNLYMATTMDGTMVISTLPNLDSMYNHMLTDNSTFSADFPTLNQSVADLGYFDFTAFNDYVTMMMKDLDAPQEVVTGYTDFMSPFKDISWTSMADSDTVWATMYMNVDVEGLAKTIEITQNWMTTAYGDYGDYGIPDYAESLTPAFCDVEDTDWFSPYVFDLSKMDIVKGYEDGCFHPERNVTRAEFTKMVMTAEESMGSYYPYDSQEMEERFLDVNYDSDWFAPYIDQAAANDLVKGFNDKTFHPNAPISRAEAVQVLYNTSNQLKMINTLGQSLESLNAFSDVKSTDWYFTAVTAAKYYNLVSGATPIKFEPNRNLTRAEAAKIISGFYNLESPTE